MTDVVVSHLPTDRKVKIKCRDYVKKIALYNDRYPPRRCGRGRGPTLRSCEGATSCRCPGSWSSPRLFRRFFRRLRGWARNFVARGRSRGRRRPPRNCKLVSPPVILTHRPRSSGWQSSCPTVSTSGSSVAMPRPRARREATPRRRPCVAAPPARATRRGAGPTCITACARRKSTPRRRATNY